MKNFLIALCACLMAAVDCHAQQPVETPAPLLFVYVVKYGENALPRIALGLEKPALKIDGFEKCVTLSRVNPKLGGLAAQLKPDDAKTLVAAMKALAAPDAKEIPAAILWFTTPDNKALGLINTANPPSNETNIVKSGVLYLDSDDAGFVIGYLMKNLHLQ